MYSINQILLSVLKVHCDLIVIIAHIVKLLASKLALA